MMQPDFRPPLSNDVIRSSDGIVVAVGVTLAIVALLISAFLLSGGPAT